MVLANRLQPIISSIINSCQYIFMQGRSILDNIMLIQELVKNYHKNGGIPRGAIKMDLMKAYDLAGWAFLFVIMTVLWHSQARSYNGLRAVLLHLCSKW